MASPPRSMSEGNEWKFTRRQFLGGVVFSTAGLMLLGSCRQQVEAVMTTRTGSAIYPTTVTFTNLESPEPTPLPVVRVIKTEEQWQQVLTPQQFHITREKGTEAPFSGKYFDHFEKGVYQCVCCAGNLFSSEAKFRSNEGWPAFYAPVNDNAVKTALDLRFGLVRLEVICTRCDAHLGHVFNDGPPPTGMRYCIDSLALNFIPAG